MYYHKHCVSHSLISKTHDFKCNLSIILICSIKTAILDRTVIDRFLGVSFKEQSHALPSGRRVILSNIDPFVCHKTDFLFNRCSKNYIRLETSSLLYKVENWS